MLHRFRHSISSITLPEHFTDPFRYTPHPLCVLAAQEVQEYLQGLDLWKREPEEGKMFGVLAVRTPTGEIGFLAAFSGILDGSYLHPYFVPPVYNLQEPSGFFRQEEQAISILNERICRLETDPAYITRQKQLSTLTEEARQVLAAAKADLRAAKAVRNLIRTQQSGLYDEKKLIQESQHQKAEYKRLERRWKEQINFLETEVNTFTLAIETLKTERRQRSAALQQKLFGQFRFLNARGEEKDLYHIFRETARKTPPAGAGECAAPKLLQYAYRHRLFPIAMAEFWWGCSPKTEIRHQGSYYPACKGKCEPILQHMLQGLSIADSSEETSGSQTTFPPIVYEDEWLVVVDKPAGLLSVPGKIASTSVYDLARQYYPEASGPLIVHRLDMATSGLLLIAKTKTIHAQLQHQFLRHTISKRYIALLDGLVPSDEGWIRLPLCPDPDDRPRQIVHEQYGKPAITRYQVITRTPTQTRIAFYPETGRTHQLRVHAAHPLGLNCPITGDELYGRKSDRLYLHAECLRFIHPVTGQPLCLTTPSPF